MAFKPASVSPEEALDVRARAWSYVFDCYAKKKSTTSEEKPASPLAGEDAKKERK